jgi:hypothetical protein
MIALSPVFSGCTTSGKKSDGPITVVGNTERPPKTTVPGNEMFKSGKMINPRTYNTKSFDTKMAPVNGEPSQVVMSELSQKEITTHDTISVTNIDTPVTENPSTNLVVTTSGDSDFQTIIQRYQKDREDPMEPGMSDVDAGQDAVSLADINRYADSAEIVDQDGIPVEKMVGGDEESTSEPVIRD